MENYFSFHAPERIAKAQKIKAIITDVDGVLTDGGIIYDNAGVEFKRFNVKDGQVIKTLREQGLLTGVITGRNSEVVKFRCRELKFDFHHHGVKNKVAVLEKELLDRNLTWEEVAYIGDDLPDLCIFEKCGLSVLPSDGLAYLQKEVDWVAQAVGGSGVFREVADFILWAQGRLESVIARNRLGE
ncbi:3-deoxy-manno-octulosonate-8-phosphatase [Cytophagales bacterium LB-30]|uniref:3-deoxy-D-manno-octulosonate 8-phosphate phosphatase KdsC n=1 Tax=Shiella aurantiaca TaxID=3058365 RepID=A0ABT8F7Y6_9BACT|nr:3-deoxy-manno-octulosonate-8-phosphatase [Shiella aurantiaca]MDN4166602.1 3-deoxy-manno-octulosonate-8-phosphatase [Shiella aurantiaca]